MKPEAKEAKTPLPVTAQRAAEQENRIAKLEAAIVELQARMAELEKRAGAGPSPVGGKRSLFPWS